MMDIGLDGEISEAIKRAAEGMMGISEGDVKKNILARDRLALMCLESQIANLLYPASDFPMARDKEAQLSADYPEFCSRLKARVNDGLKRIEKLKTTDVLRE